MAADENSYWSRKVRGELKEGWSRRTDHVDSTLTVEQRGQWGAELNTLLAANFGSDIPPFKVQTSALLSIPDLRKLIATLTRICDSAEKEA